MGQSGVTVAKEGHGRGLGGWEQIWVGHSGGLGGWCGSAVVGSRSGWVMVSRSG